MSAEPWEIHQTEFLVSAIKRQDYPRQALPQVAFAGRSNVGKSSLLNCLVRRKRIARTSRSPGLTQQINFFLVNARWHYVDLPGYGYAKAPPAAQERWRKMLEEYLVRNPNLRLVVLLIDSRRGPSEPDDQLVEFLRHHHTPVLVVLTKCDKLKREALLRARKTVVEHYGLGEPHGLILTSADKRTGRAELLEFLHEILEADLAAAAIPE